MTYKNTKRQAEVEITSFSKKGNGLGKFTIQDGSTREAEIPFTMPGDRVQACLTKRRAGLSSGQLEEILQTAPNRIAPRCVHFGVCGGCRWQHVPYSEQLQIKQDLVRKYFRDLLSDAIEFRPIVPCDPPWEYRNKMEFSFSSDSHQNKYLGMVMDSSRGKVFNLTECHLVNPWYSKAVETVRQWWLETGLEAYHPYRNTGSLRTLIVREGQRTGDRLVMLTVSGNPDYALKKHQLESFVAMLKQAIMPKDSATLTIFLRIQQIAKGMPTNFYEMLLFGPDHLREQLNIQIQKTSPTQTIEFTVSPSAFFQPNTRQAEKLYSLALQMVEINRESTVYDLYCGTGTLGICAALYAKEVIGIELSPESSLDARTNAKNNQISNITILTGAVNEVINQRKKSDPLPAPDVIMVDPPRAGLDPEVIRQLLEIGAPKLLYISCNPATQAQNIAELVQGGYRLKAIQPVDQFPQTVHVENIAIMEK